MGNIVAGLYIDICVYEILKKIAKNHSLLLINVSVKQNKTKYEKDIYSKCKPKLGIPVDFKKYIYYPYHTNKTA